MTGRPLWQWSATDIAAATRSGDVSCREVAASAVERMRTVNPRLNAVTLDLGDTALAAADALDARRLRGEPPGPLFGVPITIKDNVEVRGQRTPNGVAGLAHIIARDDAPIVRHLLDAGAVIVGRTNTPEFSMRATTNNALYGLTLNPWDARISCGGSSGGAAAAVASGICAIGHGNDVAGSIRFPAMHCGVAGFKPTSPAHAPLMSIQGPLARCVADIGLGARGHAAARREPPGPAIRGRARRPRHRPDRRDSRHADRALGGPGAARRHGGAGSGRLRRRAGRRAGHRRLGRDGAALPDDRAGAPRGADRAPAGERADQLVLRQLGERHAALPHARGLPRGRRGARAILARWERVLATHPVILLPQRADPLLEVDEDLRSTEHLRHVLRGYAPSATVNLLGLPSAFVPTGLGDGLPTGVQIVAGAHREDLCLAAAAAIEARLGTLVEQLWRRA